MGVINKSHVIDSIKKLTKTAFMAKYLSGLCVVFDIFFQKKYSIIKNGIENIIPPFQSMDSK